MTTDTDRLWEMLEDISICMVTTKDGDVLRSRPMAPYVDEEKRTIRFITDGESAKLLEIAENRDIALSFADQSKMIFASVSAKASVSRNKALIAKMWGPYAEIFISGGPDEADVAVIEAQPEQAEFWDNSKGKIAIAAEMTRAFFSDDGSDLGDNAKLDLS